MIDTILNNLNLERIFLIIKKRLVWMIIFTTLGGVGVGYYSMSTSYQLYNATISMYVYGDQNYIYDSSVNVSYSELRKARDLVPSYILVLKSNTVLTKIIEKVGVDYSTDAISGMISAGPVDETAVFYVNVINPDPYIAMSIANAIADIAPAEIARVVKSGGVEVIDYATLPKYPYAQTDVVKFTIIGAVGGFALSFVIFLFFGLLDTTIRKKNELTTTYNIPILGDVPMIFDVSRKIKTDKVLGESSPFGFKEAYNSIRTNIMFTGRAEKCPVFVVTSADKAEGKTLNCINLAVTFAHIGKKTLIIDGDLRKPSVYKRLFASESSDGLSNYVAGLSDTVNVSTTHIPNLSVLSAGRIPPNPSELIGSVRFEELLGGLRDQYDYIFIDVPPVGIVSDALAISKIITGYVLVVKSNTSKIDFLTSVVQLLEQVDANICGFIYNAVNPKSGDYKYKKYKNGYGK